MKRKIPTTFTTTLFSFEKVNSTLSKGRLAIFSPGENINGTFISDEVSAGLVSSIAYQPIKGIFDFKEGDFQGHGEDWEGRGYGVVPAECNPAIEKVYDPRVGEEVDYVCVDVYLWTHLYEEANMIIGKRQSMELNAETITGKWGFSPEGKRLFYYDFAEFQGFQVLGDDFIPAFGGSHFFEEKKEQDSYNTLIGEVVKYTKSEQKDYSELLGEIKAIISDELAKFSADGEEKEEDEVGKENETPNVEFSELEIKLQKQVKDLTVERDTLATQFGELEGTVEALSEFKAGVLAERREKMIDKYATLMGKETADSVAEKFAELDNESLEKELALAAVNAKFEEAEFEEEPEEEAEEQEEKEEPEEEEEEAGGKFTATDSVKFKLPDKRKSVGSSLDSLVGDYKNKGGRK